MLIIALLIAFAWVKYGDGRKHLKGANKPKPKKPLSLLRAQYALQNDARAYHAVNDALTASVHPLPSDKHMDHTFSFIPVKTSL